MKPTKLFFRLLFCTFMLNVFFMSAQSDVCGTAEPTTPDPSGVYSHSIDPAYLDTNCEPIVLNIYFWGIKHPNGVDYYPNQDNDVLTALANLNILYNQFNIFFKYRGFEKILSPGLPNDSNGYFVLENSAQYHSLFSWAAANGYKKTDAFNVYIYGWGAHGGLSPGYSVTTTAVAAAGVTKSTVNHEIGHNLNLIHTRSSKGINGERVTRDINDPDYNADEKGDQVIDTAANPGYLVNGTYPYINSNCYYVNDGTQKDYDGDEYIPTHQDVINVLSDAYECMNAYSPLTIGQGIRAREALIDDVYGNFAPTLTTIASLYEPYAGIYYDPNNPNDAVYKPLFQPGFNYRFVECDCDCLEPTPYEDTSFSYTQNVIKQVSKYESDYSTIYHPNHTAISIDLDLCDSYGQNTRRCYDNPYRRPKAGSVTRFNDNVFNTNVTITPKDSLGINSPTLVEELNPGLYKIEMVYDEGNTEETVIFKEN